MYVGGVPIDSYAVEYKEARSEWTQAKRRVWPAGNLVVVQILYNRLIFQSPFFHLCSIGCQIRNTD